MTRALPGRLRFVRALERRETGPGFAARLAALNGRRMGEMFHHLGIRPHLVDAGDEHAMRMVAALGDADPAQIIRNTTKTVDGKRHYHVAGDVLGVLGINRTFFRFCPACVMEDIERYGGPAHSRPWLRLEWTVMHYRACMHHNLYLTRAEPLRRRFQSFDFAETVESLLPNISRLRDEAARSPVSEFDRWVTRRLDGEKAPNNWLDTLSLYVAAEWCEAFGVSMLHPSKVATSKLTEAQWAAAADEGFKVSSAGPDSIRSALMKMTSAERRTRGIVGPRDTYGYGYHVLEKTMDDPAYEPIRAVVRDYALTALPWKVGANILGTVLETPVVVSARTLAKAAGADVKTIKKILRKKKIAVKDLDDQLRSHRTLMLAEVAAPLASSLKGALTIPATMKLLGVERRQVQAIVDAGALPYASGTDRDFRGQSRFAREDIDAMMARLLEGAVEIEAPNDRQVDIATARHIAGATTVQVLKLIFEKRIGWKGRLAGRTDYNAVLLDADDITLIVREDAPQFTNLRFCDVGTVVPGLTEKSVQPLLDLGVLVETMEYSPNARREVRVVTAASVEAFRSRYVTAGELCQTHGLHHKQVKYRLLAQGVEPAFDLGVVNAMIYERNRIWKLEWQGKSSSPNS